MVSLVICLVALVVCMVSLTLAASQLRKMVGSVFLSNTEWRQLRGIYRVILTVLISLAFAWLSLFLHIVGLLIK
jgi:hypothetical protein